MSEQYFYLKDSDYAHDDRVGNEFVDWDSVDWRVWNGREWFDVRHIRHMGIFRVCNDNGVKLSEQPDDAIDLNGVLRSLIGDPQ